MLVSVGGREMVEIINLIEKLLEVGMPLWLIVILVIYSLVMKKGDYFNIKKANEQFMNQIEIYIRNNDDENLLHKFDDLIDIICIGNSINRNFLISYEVAVAKALYKVVSEMKNSDDVFKYIEKNKKMMELARRKDAEIKYGKYTPIEVYIKAYIFASVVTVAVFCIASYIKYGIGVFDAMFLGILIICSLIISLIGMLLTMIIERLKNYLIKMIIK